MTKNYEQDEMAPPPSNPRSPQEEVLNFIETLGEHLEDALSAATSHTEKGETSATGANANERNIPDPPDYWEEQDQEPGSTKSDSGDKSSEAGDNPNRAYHHHHHFHRNGENNNNNRRGCRRGPGEGAWGRDWRQAAEQWFTQGFPGGGRGGRGGFGGPWGRGGFPFGGPPPHHHGGPPQFGGPWGWNSNLTTNVGGGGGGWGKWNRRGNNNNNDDLGADQTFTPAVDIFDTPDNFTVHVALAGSLKSDIGINYDFETSELQVSGVVHRPGDEEFLKYMVSSERRVGAFDTKVKLYDQQGQTVAVDADAITATMENGLLEVVVPKVKKDQSEKKKKISIL